MKEKKNVAYRIKTIHKLIQKIIKEFDADAIHHLRVEVKKLRAFLRLTEVEGKINRPLISKLLKKIYRHVGIIRNIKLQRHTVLKYMRDNNIPEPVAYIKILDKKKHRWQKKTGELIEENDFKDDDKKITRHLNGKLKKTSGKIFLENKLNELKDQLKDMDDNNTLHRIRKILKDVQYNYDFIKDYTLLPNCISKKKDLKTITETLGNFMDKCMEIEFLQPEYLNKIKDAEEKNWLLQMKNVLARRKQTMKNQLQYKLKILQQQL